VAQAFADRLIQRVRALGHPLCVGLDPQLERIPPPFRRGAMKPGDPETAEAVAEFCLAVLERVAERVAVVKPQSAFFEALGWTGVRALGDVLRAARAQGLLVILDAKRGDIGSTAEGYAAAYLAEAAPLAADALTVSPWLGFDSCEPFLEAARSTGRGLFVLARTSNPGARDLQELEASGKRLYEHVAQGLAQRAGRLAGAETGWSGLGLVAGATWPEEARRLRDLAPSNLFLVPGYGAQGASAAQAVAGFVRGSSGCLEGGVVSSSRAIVFPDTDARTWEKAVDEALERAIAELGAAVA